jgi:tetratricopeptide (TPR) repeat protein
LKSATHLLLTVVFTILFVFSGQSQKKPLKRADFDSAYYLFYYNKWDSALVMFNQYINKADDTLKKGKAYSYIGEMQSGIGDFYGAQQSLLDAVKTLDPLNEKHHEEIGITFNLLGNVSLNLKQYDEAIKFYDSAMIFSKGTDYSFEVVNGKATALQKKGSYTEAIAIYDSILALKPVEQLLVARVTDNRARTKWLQNPGYPALPEFQRALKIRRDSSLDLNASYAHLSDFYARSNSDSAFWYAQKMYALATENQSSDDILEAIDKIIRLNNSPAVKQQWYERYKTLNDSLLFSRDTTRNRFALIRYGVEKSKADNLALSFEVEKKRVDNLELQQDNTRQRLLIYGVSVIALAIIFCLWIWYSKRRKRLKLEAENAIRDSKLKTSQKIHDVVANGLYVIMNELEHGKAIEREPLITKIEGLYEKSRDISYEEIRSGNSVSYNNQIHDLLNSYANEQTKVFIVGNQETFWSKIISSQKHELQLVLNEIMINMKKHSHAKNVAIVFKQEDSKAFITYKDDGVGFLTGHKFGNGLNNTVSRIKSIHGAINFEKNEKGGVSISISFPLESSKI